MKEKKCEAVDVEAELEERVGHSLEAVCSRCEVATF